MPLFNSKMAELGHYPISRCLPFPLRLLISSRLNPLPSRTRPGDDGTVWFSRVVQSPGRRSLCSFTAS